MSYKDVVWLNPSIDMNVMSADENVHLVDLMFPNQTKSLFNEFMRKAFPHESTVSYIMEWWYRFFGHDVSTEPSVNYMFMHDDDTDENGLSSISYPQCKMDGTENTTGQFFDLAIGRLEALKKQREERMDSKCKPQIDGIRTQRLIKSL